MIAGQLRPERAFDPEILPRDNRARVGQKIAGIGDMGPDRAQIIAQHQQGHVVFAHDIVPGHQLIACGLKLIGLRDRIITGIAHPAFLELHGLERIGPRDRDETTATGQTGTGLSANRSSMVGRVTAGIFVDAEHGAEGGVGRMANFQGLPAKDHPVRVERRSRSTRARAAIADTDR